MLFPGSDLGVFWTSHEKVAFFHNSHNNLDIDFYNSDGRRK